MSALSDYRLMKAVADKQALANSDDFRRFCEIVGAPGSHVGSASADTLSDLAEEWLATNGSGRKPEFASPGELEEAIGFGLDNPERLEWLRTETRDGFRLDLWNTGEEREGKAQLAYRLCHEQANQPDVWMIVFAGEEFYAGMGLLVDDDQVLADILGFLSLKPGDIEDDYFERHAYTPWQMGFAERWGEELSIWSSDLEGTD